MLTSYMIETAVKLALGMVYGAGILLLLLVSLAATVGVLSLILKVLA